MSAVEFLSKTSEAELLQMSIRQLYELSNGIVPTFKKYSKEELVIKLLESVGRTSEQLLAKQMGYGKYAEEPEVAARKIYAEILTTLMSEDYKPHHLIKIATTVLYGEKNLLGQVTQEPLAFTTKNKRRIIIADEITRKLNKEFSDRPDILKTYLEDVENYFFYTLSTAYQPENRVRRKSEKERVSKANRGLENIKITPLIQWATEVFHRIDTISDWRELAFALAILTGRRESEILATGIFNLTDQNIKGCTFYANIPFMSFKGQLKGDKYSSNRLKDHIIPVFVNPILVIKAIDRLKYLEHRLDCPLDPLETYFDRQKEVAKKAHSKWASSLKKFADILNRQFDVNFTFHDYRSIYATMLNKMIKNSVVLSNKVILSDALGHDSSNGLSNSQDNYTIYSVDMDELEALHEFFRNKF